MEGPASLFSLKVSSQPGAYCADPPPPSTGIKESKDPVLNLATSIMGAVSVSRPGGEQGEWLLEPRATHSSGRELSDGSQGLQ